MLVRVRVWRGRGVNVREGGCVMRAEMEPWVPSVLPITECHPISNASVPGTWIWCPRCYEAAAFVQEAGARARTMWMSQTCRKGGVVRQCPAAVGLESAESRVLSRNRGLCGGSRSCCLQESSSRVAIAPGKSATIYLTSWFS